MAEKTGSTVSTGSQASSPVAGQQNGGSPGRVAPGVSAASSVPAFGGNRGGKSRRDGLAPGSQAAKEADRKRDAERKRLAREEAARLAEPPPLPSAAETGNGSLPPPVNGLAPGAPGAVPVQSDVVPWDPGTIRPLLEELINGSEQSRVQKRKTRAVAVGLPDRIVKEVAGDANYPDAAKRALALSGANGTAKILNGLGVSGKYSDAAIASTALIAILISNRRSDARFEEMIAEFKKSQVPKPAQTKP